MAVKPQCLDHPIMIKVAPSRQSSVAPRSAWMDNPDDFWLSMQIFSETHPSGAMNESAFIVLDPPVTPGPERLLYVLVHPGDLILSSDGIDDIEDEELAEALTDESFAAQKAHVRELTELRRRGSVDLIVLHRDSSGYAFSSDRWVDSEYKRLLENAQKEQSGVLYGDGLEDVAAWLVSNLDAGRRPSVIVGGCWGAAGNGCAATLAQKLHDAGCRVTLSDAAPTGFGDTETPRWSPPPTPEDRQRLHQTGSD